MLSLSPCAIWTPFCTETSCSTKCHNFAIGYSDVDRRPLASPRSSSDKALDNYWTAMIKHTWGASQRAPLWLHPLTVRTRQMARLYSVPRSISDRHVSVYLLAANWRGGLEQRYGTGAARPLKDHFLYKGSLMLPLISTKDIQFYFFIE